MFWVYRVYLVYLESPHKRDILRSLFLFPRHKKGTFSQILPQNSFKHELGHGVILLNFNLSKLLQILNIPSDYVKKFIEDNHALFSMKAIVRIEP